MKLTDEQKAAVHGWIEEGKNLAEVQSLLESEHDLRLTYMDVRFLIDDLQLEIRAQGPQFTDPKAASLDQPPPAPGTVSVTLDKISRPDANISGQVTFSDGIQAKWHLDQMGRLALDAGDPGYKPSQEDLQAFQNELRSAVEKSGMM